MEQSLGLPLPALGEQQDALLSLPTGLAAAPQAEVRLLSCFAAWLQVCQLNAQLLKLITVLQGVSSGLEIGARSLQEPRQDSESQPL